MYSTCVYIYICTSLLLLVCGASSVCIYHWKRKSICIYAHTHVYIYININAMYISDLSRFLFRGGVIFIQLWCHFDVVLVLIWCHFGFILVPLGVISRSERPRGAPQGAESKKLRKSWFVGPSWALPGDLFWSPNRSQIAKRSLRKPH